MGAGLVVQVEPVGNGWLGLARWGRWGAGWQPGLGLVGVGVGGGRGGWGGGGGGGGPGWCLGWRAGWGEPARVSRLVGWYGQVAENVYTAQKGVYND